MATMEEGWVPLTKQDGEVDENTITYIYPDPSASGLV